MVRAAVAAAVVVEDAAAVAADVVGEIDASFKAQTGITFCIFSEDIFTLRLTKRH
jgi:hypothetical protein